MKTSNLTFNEIMMNDGLYHSKGNFSKGYALKVENRTLYLVGYKSVNDLLPSKELPVISSNLVNNMKFDYVYNIKSLFE